MDNIVFSKPTIRRKEMASVVEALVDDKIGPGERRKDFHYKFLELFDFTGAAIASFRTLNDSLKIALNLCGVKENSKVIISALSPLYYKDVIQEMGAEPLIVDVDKETGLLNYEKASKFFENCDAIIYYEPFGSVPEINEFDGLSIPIIEDISESFLCGFEENKAGNIGNYVIYSLEDNSLISAGGGSVLISKKYTDRKVLRESAKKEIALCDLNAALAIVQISKLSQNKEIRISIFKEYTNALMKSRHKLLGLVNEEYSNSGYGFCVLTKNKSTDIINFAKKNKIEIKIPFKNRVVTFNEETSDNYINAKSIYFRTVAFPIYPFLRQAEKDQIIKILSNLP